MEVGADDSVVAEIEVDGSDVMVAGAVGVTVAETSVVSGSQSSVEVATSVVVSGSHSSVLVGAISVVEGTCVVTSVPVTVSVAVG